jgi:rod shape determining protein RodA
MSTALALIGAMAVGSAEESLLTKQFAGVAAGVVVMLIVSFLNYTWVLRFQWIIYIFNIILLLAVQFTGDEGRLGAQRWLELGPLRFQPSETAKILLILFFAQFIMRYKDKLNTFRIICFSGLLILAPWYLIFMQPDLSTSIIVLLVFCCILFAGGLSFKLILGVFSIVIPAVALVLFLALQPGSPLLKDYQQDRIMAFINPQEYANEEAYQQLNSVMAIGSGQLDGKGYKNNEITSVKNGNFLSEAQTDFIFAVIGEEFGFKGTALVILLLMGISLECISVARKAQDTAGTIIATGVGCLVAFQSFFNIGVATFILPNTGLPLPFVSYGLTSLISLFAGIGFVINVRLQPKKLK